MLVLMKKKNFIRKERKAKTTIHLVKYLTMKFGFGSKQYSVLRSTIIVSFSDFVEAIFEYPMEFSRNIVYKQVWHPRRRIYFFHSFSFHKSNRRNDPRSTFYYRLHKLNRGHKRIILDPCRSYPLRLSFDCK